MRTDHSRLIWSLQCYCLWLCTADKLTLRTSVVCRSVWRHWGEAADRGNHREREKQTQEAAAWRRTKPGWASAQLCTQVFTSTNTSCWLFLLNFRWILTSCNSFVGLVSVESYNLLYSISCQIMVRKKAGCILSGGCNRYAMWYNHIIAHNGYPVFTLVESTVSQMHSLQILFKSSHYSGRCRRKCMWFFWTQCTFYCGKIGCICGLFADVLILAECFSPICICLIT